jgi:hypothetical protein
MPWKILSIISILCLGGTCYFAFANKKALSQEKLLAQRADENLAEAQKLKADVIEATGRSEAKFAQLEKDRDATKEEVVKLAAEAQEREAALALLKQNLDQVTEQVRAVQKQIDEAGDIEQLVAQISELKKQETTAEGTVAGQNQRLASAEQRATYLGEQIEKFRVAEANARKGVVDSDFTARISTFFPAWGFAILDKGNSGGVFAKADLEVKRGNEVVAKLKVRNVEQYRAIADVVDGSVAEGTALRSGDLVVAAAEQSAAEEAPSGAATATGDGGEAGAPAAESPAAEAAPAADSGMSDPFGGGGSMDSSAPAAPSGDTPMSDPFGGGSDSMSGSDSSSGGDTPMSDPFGS